jgi:hypothetical protein
MYYDARYHGVVFRPYPDLIMTPDILADLWGFMKKGYTPRPWWQRWARELWEAWLVHLEELQVWEREIKI